MTLCTACVNSAIKKISREGWGAIPMFLGGLTPVPVGSYHALISFNVVVVVVCFFGGGDYTLFDPPPPLLKINLAVCTL